MQSHSVAASRAATTALPARMRKADIGFAESAAILPFPTLGMQVPQYLRTHYWWAYIHPSAVRLFERQWLVNLILWGNYASLRDAALADMETR